MRVLFSEELKQVADDLDTMVGDVRDAITAAGKSLLDADVETAQGVIDGDKTIDDLEERIVNQCVLLLAKQTPVATDLRVVVSTFRLASTIERMGDLASHIAQTTRRTYPDSAIPESARKLFMQMNDDVATVAQRVIEMLEHRDIEIAESIIADDDKLDALHNASFALLTSPAWEGTVQQTIDVVLLSRFFERFGDHAVSAARRVIYIVSGFDPAQVPEKNGQAD
jgi:phosphate transport system protein